ncbi:hypothetical protein BJF85_03095 [Saccharomonospora sp. CUA-673]|uniref:fluoride efflux transporter FluC n=1 Tax=Saccharomonospora sp. CUA-673 TaxID=1904969 RepID=UPI000961CFC8|nr:CrcB family protein [Saccharomonospora sp. CUA-673]OLT43083.1 hypothetical protein BJF85_03095 [Saccharomonospora sp. CUA-673]
MTGVMVLLGGAGGAVLRYLIDLRLRRGQTGAFPRGTFVANLVGSGLLGVLTAWVLSAGVEGEAVFALAGIGLCGSLTTFSTFGYDTVRLIEQRRSGTAAGYVLLTIAGGLLAAGAGLWAGSTLFG